MQSRFHKSVSQTLTAGAVFSDAVESPALSLDGFGAFAAGTICVEPLLASPTQIFVRAHSLDVLASDTNAAGGTVAVIAAARLGTDVAQADRTIPYTSSCARASTIHIT